MFTRSLFFVSLFALALPACGTPADPATADDSDSLDGKADKGGVGSRYFEIRPDLRKCAAPACGGSFVKRVNYATTTCADGVSRSECYVAVVDFTKSELGADEQASFAGKAIVVRGDLVNQSYPSGSFANLAVKEVWVAAGDATAGSDYAPVAATLYKVVDSGLRCITWPCLTYRETKLNQSHAVSVAGVDLAPAGASDDVVAAAMTAMTTDGILVDGSNQSITGPSGTAQQLVASRFFTRVAPVAEPVLKSCGGLAGLGCDEGQVCDVTVANACNGADLPGVCKPAGQLCSQLYAPVCGCDGKTYSNDCVRLQAGVQLDHTGACAN